MTTPFTRPATDTSFGALLNRAITAAFTLAVVGAVGVMTFSQFVAMA